MSAPIPSERPARPNGKARRGEMTKYHRPRKIRRLTLKQAVLCELGMTRAYAKAGHPGGVYRCRCGGQLRGRGKCNPDPNRANRWDFAILDPNDPHYIPPMTRRVSPRRAVQVLADAAARVGNAVTTAAKQANGILLAARRKLDVIVAARRVYSRVRMYRARILEGALPAPCEHLDRIRYWLERRALYPPGSAPAHFSGACQIGMAVLLSLKAEILGTRKTVPVVERGKTTHEHRQLRLLLAD